MTDTEPFAAPLYECSEPPAGDLLARARRLTAHDASAAGERLLQVAIRELVARVEELEGRLAEVRNIQSDMQLIGRGDTVCDGFIAQLARNLDAAITRTGDEQR